MLEPYYAVVQSWHIFVELSDTILPHISQEFTWCQAMAMGQNHSADHPKSAKTESQAKNVDVW